MAAVDITLSPPSLTQRGLSLVSLVTDLRVESAEDPDCHVCRRRGGCVEHVPVLKGKLGDSMVNQILMPAKNGKNCFWVNGFKILSPIAGRQVVSTEFVVSATARSGFYPKWGDAKGRDLEEKISFKLNKCNALLPLYYLNGFGADVLETLGVDAAEVLENSMTDDFTIFTKYISECVVKTSDADGNIKTKLWSNWRNDKRKLNNTPCQLGISPALISTQTKYYVMTETGKKQSLTLIKIHFRLNWIKLMAAASNTIVNENGDVVTVQEELDQSSDDDGPSTSAPVKQMAAAKISSSHKKKPVFTAIDSDSESEEEEIISEEASEESEEEMPPSPPPKVKAKTVVKKEVPRGKPKINRFSFEDEKPKGRKK